MYVAALYMNADLCTGGKKIMKPQTVQHINVVVFLILTLVVIFTGILLLVTNSSDTAQKCFFVLKIFKYVVFVFAYLFKK